MSTATIPTPQAAASPSLAAPRVARCCRKCGAIIDILSPEITPSGRTVCSQHPRSGVMERPSRAVDELRLGLAPHELSEEAWRLFQERHPQAVKLVERFRVRSAK